MGLTRFKSERHRLYGQYLDGLGLEWYYREFWVPYRDELSGKPRRKYADFTVLHPGGLVEWVECRRADRMVPDTGRICLARRAADAGVVYRGLAPAELGALRKS